MKLQRPILQSARGTAAVFAASFFLVFAVFPIFPAAMLRAEAATRQLRLGSSGADVQTLQQKLIDQGYLAAGNDSSYFGPATEAAVKKFQCAVNIACAEGAAGYGQYGPKTQAALASATKNIVGNPASASASDASLTKAATGAFEISGWVPYWKTASGTADVLPHLDLLKSVMPFGYTMKSDGTLVDTAKLSQEPWVSFASAARASGTRVVPTVMWGDGAAMQKVLGNTNARISLEDQIAAAVKENGWDGIDVDFEAKQHASVNYFSTFLKGLQSRLGSKKWIYCTVESRIPLEDRYLPGDTIPPDATDYANDYQALNTYCDRVEIMAYDQGTVDKRLDAARAAPYAPVADPGWVESVVRLAARTISRNKLVLGIPTYGYEYSVTNQDGGNYSYHLLWPFNPKYATGIAASLGIAPARTSADEAGFAYDPKDSRLNAAPTGAGATEVQQSGAIAASSVAVNGSGGISGAGGAAGGITAAAFPAISLPSFNFLSWSDAQAVADKVKLAHELGLRGVAVFKFDGGEDAGVWATLGGK